MFDFKPISEFPKTDDYVQPEVILKTETGMIYFGEWDGESGYFFIDGFLKYPTSVVQENEMPDEFPGRLYATVVEFAYTGN